MALTIGAQAKFDLSKPSPQLNHIGHKEVLTLITFDSSYAHGGEALAASDVGLDEILSVEFEVRAGVPYEFTWDNTNKKIKAHYAGEPRNNILVIQDDDSAESNGTDILVDSTETVGAAANLTSVNANNATAALEIANDAGYAWVQDDNSAASNGTALFFDETNYKFLSANAANRNVQVPVSNGGCIRVFDDDSAASNGTAVHFDDNAANEYERMLIIATGNADLTVDLSEVVGGTDLSAISVRARVRGA